MDYFGQSYREQSFVRASQLDSELAEIDVGRLYLRSKVTAWTLVNNNVSGINASTPYITAIASSRLIALIGTIKALSERFLGVRVPGGIESSSRAQNLRFDFNAPFDPQAPSRETSEISGCLTSQGNLKS